MIHFLLPLIALAAPNLETGDIIFQTSTSSQSKAIQEATQSKFSHVGIVEVNSDGSSYVIEAVNPDTGLVGPTPLEDWIARGVGKKYAVYRYKGISSRQKQMVLQAARGLNGRRYDIFFNFDNREIYCSELVWLAFKSIRVQLGEVQKISTLKMTPKVWGVMEARWQRHPLCKGARSFEDCKPRILDDELISPASLARDQRQLTEIFSNFK